MTARIKRLVTAGNVDAGGPPVHENNVWLVGDERHVIVVDPSHDAEAVWAAVAGREVLAVLLTHGHWDHVRSAPAFAGLCTDAGTPADRATPWLHPDDDFLWRAEHPSATYQPLTDGARFEVGDVTLEARHTPGHTPGSTSFVVHGLGAVLSGDTLFEGGPGATRWPYSSFPGIVASIESRLLTLPGETTVHTGHGTDTTVEAELARMPEYIARGW